jgi:hypothetical protein
MQRGALVRLIVILLQQKCADQPYHGGLACKMPTTSRRHWILMFIQSMG